MFGRLATLIVGGALGAGLTMMLAPRSSQEAREQLRTRAQGLRDQYGEVIEQGRVRATELVRSGLDMVDTRLQQGQELVNSGLERARTTVDQQSSESNQEQKDTM